MNLFCRAISPFSVSMLPTMSRSAVTAARAWQPAALPVARCVVPHLCSQIPVVTRAAENFHEPDHLAYLPLFAPACFCEVPTNQKDAWYGRWGCNRDTAEI